jgi:hypothetical protein
MAAADLALGQPERLEVGDAAQVVENDLADVAFVVQPERRQEAGESESAGPIDLGEGVVLSAQQARTHHDVVEPGPLGDVCPSLGAKVCEGTDLRLVDAAAEVLDLQSEEAVYVDQLAVHVLDERGVQGAIVVGMRHHEGAGQRIGDVDEHAALARVDLEDAQRVLQPPHLRPGEGVLAAGREAASESSLRPLLPSDRRTTEMQREVALHSQVQGKEAEAILGDAPDQPTPEPHRDPGGRLLRTQLGAVGRRGHVIVGPGRHERVRHVGDVGGALVDRDDREFVAVQVRVEAQVLDRLVPDQRDEPDRTPGLRRTGGQPGQRETGHDASFRNRVT